MSKARILIVEDEAIIAMEIENNLRNLDYEVTSIVNSGDRAVEKAEKERPDLILMDIRIQGDKDGIETAEIIRLKFGIPVIFSTAYLDEERIARAKITMPFGYILKPIQERDLKVTIEMALYVAKVDAERTKAEMLLRQTLDATTDGIWTWNFKTNELFFSNKYYTMLGYEPNEFASNMENWANMIHPDDRPAAVASAEEYLKTKPDVYENAFRLKTKQGEYRWIYAYAKVVERDETGDAVFMIGNHEDITERKESEKELIEIKDFYREISEKAEDGIWVTDAEDRIIYFNPGMERISGVKSADVIGLSVTNDFPEETIQHFIHFYNKARETFFSQQYEAEVVTPVGRRTIQSGWLVPRLNHGTYNGMICTIQDITDRKEVENRVAEAEDRYRQMFEENTAIKLLIDPEDGAIIDANAAASRFYGYELEALREISIFDINNLPPDRINGEMQNVKREGKRHLIFQHKTSSGEIKDVEVFSGPINSDGKVLLFSIIHDITGRKAAEKELRISEAQKKAILDGISTNIAFVNDKLEIIWANKAAGNSVNKDPDDMIGFKCYDFWADSSKPCENCPTVRAFQNKKPEKAIMHNANGKIWEETGEPVFDANNELLGVVEIAKDITQQHLTDVALKENEKKYRALFENSPYGVFLVDNNARYKEVNKAACKMTGYSRNELLQLSIPEISSPDKEIHRQDIKPFLDVQATGKGEGIIHLKHKNGRIFKARIKSVKIDDNTTMGICEKLAD